MGFPRGKYLRPTSIPAKAGIGLRAPHVLEILDTLPGIGWLEVHSENYFCDGGAPLQMLERSRQSYPLSLHGVGMSLGSTDPLDVKHLDKLKSLIERFEPALVSEHLCWSSAGGRHLNDLLPLPYNDEALNHVCERVDAVQSGLQRQILVENVSSYLQFRSSNIPEWEFVSAVAARTGCGILLDINNIYVNSVNHGFDALDYLAAIPKDKIQEIHLAGFERTETCLIDTHGSLVAPPVWELYEMAVRKSGPIPTLIEWDTDIPPLDTLLEEARKAQEILEGRDVVAA